jgi:prepilin-type processing-associated H-X9-DG protein
MTCTNHLKQFGIAVHNYHDTYIGLPLGNGWVNFTRTNNTTGCVGNWAPQFKLLPFLEQQARYDSIISFKPTGATENLSPWDNREQMRGNISVFSCPSDPNSKMDGSQRPTRTNYYVSRGDVITNQSATSDARHRFAFGWQECKGLEAISDGTSNTLAIGESGMVGVSGGSVVENDNHTDVALVLGVTGLTGTSGMSNSLNKADPTNRKLLSGTVTWFGAGDDKTATTLANTFKALRGLNIYQCIGAYTGFVAMFPPNSPHCSNWHRDDFGHFSANSYHTGGVNCTLFDGSVRFFSETINCIRSGITSPQEVTSGESEYGIWGALGSINGGESQTP